MNRGNIVSASPEATPASGLRWRCPGCWERWPVESECPNCGGNHPGLYRHPPVDPVTGEVSGADDAILMGELRHCDLPEVHRRADCLAIMDDHGYDDTLGVLCPPDGVVPFQPAEFKIWYTHQVPGQTFWRDVPDPATGQLILDTIYYLMLELEANRVIPDYANAGGITYLDEYGDWTDYQAEDWED